ncbi:MAG: hypothetical protein ACR2OC_07865 [Solirubrobacterales bacterium]
MHGVLLGVLLSVKAAQASLAVVLIASVIVGSLFAAQVISQRRLKRGGRAVPPAAAAPWGRRRIT